MFKSIETAAVAAGALAASVSLSTPGYAAGVSRTTATVNGLVADVWTWSDSNNKPRTVALRLEGHGNPGHGGYAIRMTYYRFRNAAWEKVTVNADPGGDGGFGYFVSHERERYFGNDGAGNPIFGTIAGHVFGKDDSPLGRGFAATSAIPLDTPTAGAASFTINYGHYGTVAPGGIDPDSGNDSPPLAKDPAKFKFYPIPVTTTWVFQQGRDYPRIDVSLDLSRVVPPGSATPRANLVSFDVRGPYGVMAFDNGADRDVASAIWGDQEYLFTTLGSASATRRSGWTWKGLNKGARYNGLTVRDGGGGTFEMGLFEPTPASVSALTDGYAAERGFTSASYAAAVAAGEQSPSLSSCPGEPAQTLPSDGTWPYQSLQYSLPCRAQTAKFLTTPTDGKKLAWGSSAYYGTSLTSVWNGVRSYPIEAWPAAHKLDYSVCLVLGWASNDPAKFLHPDFGTYLAAAAADYAKAAPAPAESNCATALAPSKPFPSHATLTKGVIKPTNISQEKMDATIKEYYVAWKKNYLREAGGGDLWVKYDNTNSTVSEAHGWGMVLAAYMADKPVFDSMFRYFRKHPSEIGPHLMAWKQTLSNGRMVDVEGRTSATDGDLDIAYALLLAHAQWGSSGAIKYKSEAFKVLHDILTHDVNNTTWTTTPGDWATASFDINHTRPSDFMTDHFLAFAKADSANAAKWNRIYDSVVRLVNYQFGHGSRNTGLMPDFMVKSGENFVPVPGRYLETNHDGDFNYNACRTPWRLAMAYILNGRAELLPALAKQAAWIRTKTAGTPTNIRAGYFVRNGPNGQSYVDYDDLAFTAPFAVNAMVGGAAGQTWLNSLWRSIAGGDYDIRRDYFGDTIRLQVMLTAAGDWWSP
jgi:endo-1,4-beta-D-glucanase Y